MGLLVSIVILLMFGLALFQAWQLWFTKREIARLEQRLAESLDDHDLLEFQERLQGLLSETKDAGLSLVQSLERRQEAVNQAVGKAEAAEKRLDIRTQLLELAARELVKTAPTGKTATVPPVRAKAAPKKVVKPLPQPEAAKPAPAPMEEAPKTPEPTAATAAEEAARRYTSRPANPSAAPNRYQRVYELSDQGLSREQIARESGILPGEVDLILNLRPGKRR